MTNGSGRLLTTGVGPTSAAVDVYSDEWLNAAINNKQEHST